MRLISKRTLQNWLIAFLIIVYLATCAAVSYNALSTAQHDNVVPNLYFERPTPQVELIHG